MPFIFITDDDNDDPDENSTLAKQIQALLGQAGLQAAAAGASGGTSVGGLGAADAGATAGLQAAAGAAGLLGLGLYGDKLTNSLTVPQTLGLNTGMDV